VVAPLVSVLTGAVTRRRRLLAAALVAGCGALCIAAGVAELVDAGPAVRAEPVGVVPGQAAGTSPVLAAVPLPGPDWLDLPQRRVTAPVVPVGVDAAGAMAVPDPATTVGWWSGGARPGDATGTVVLVGHVDSRATGLGAFAALPALVPGEPVDVRAANGHTVRYRVSARRSYRKADLPAAVFARDGPARLVLITCGGRFDRGERSYQDNVVVYALPTRP
jgi:Sortase domain